MRTTPDGVEVVVTHAQAEKLTHPPLLILEPLRDFLDHNGIGRGPIAWQRIGNGQSNVTFRIRRADTDLVLRRGPRPPLPPSTHDMLREAQIQGLLRPRGIPVPEVLAVCDDESILGVPFYLMETLDGVIVGDTIPSGLDTTSQRAAISTALVDNLVRLHSIDVSPPDLAAFGRPNGYLARQVERFAGLWSRNTTRDLPQVEQIADWLRTNLPTTQAAAVVHGDYRLGNLMFDPTSPVRVQAILDWEMATLGDPLADLGYLTATYSDQAHDSTPLELSPVTKSRGFLTRDQLAQHYAEQSDLDLTNLPWYQTLALWKAAIFCEAIYTRWLHGERPHDTHFAPSMERGVPQLLHAAENTMRT